jgi:hypothetical protein
MPKDPRNAAVQKVRRYTRPADTVTTCLLFLLAIPQTRFIALTKMSLRCLACWPLATTYSCRHVACAANETRQQAACDVTQAQGAATARSIEPSASDCSQATSSSGSKIGVQSSSLTTYMMC